MHRRLATAEVKYNLLSGHCIEEGGESGTAQDLDIASKELCQAECDKEPKCTAYEFQSPAGGKCRIFETANMTSDDVISADYDCMVRILDAVEEISADKAWYDDIWGNYVKVYLFELLKIFGGYIQASLLKYSNKYLMQLLTGHNF